MRFRFHLRGLRARLLATYLILIVLSLGVLVWRVGTWLEASRFAETRRDQEGRAILSASVVEELLEQLRLGEMDQAKFGQAALGLSQEISQRIVILDAEGRVIVDSERPQEARSDLSRDPEIIGALQGRVAYAIRFDADDQMDALFTAAPIRHDQDLLGIVRLELPMSAVSATNQRTWLMLGGTALLAGFATVLVSFWFSRSLVRPIAELTRAASAVANGDLQQRIRASGPEELRRLAYGFNFMAQRISRVMEDQRAFVANAAHELRTPLTTIRLRAEALYEGAKDDPEVSAQFLADIVNETDRLARLVDELLDLSRIETGMATPRREPVAMTTLAGAVAEKLAPSAAEAGVALEVSPGDKLPPVSADPDQLRQVLINLIANAIKFTPPGGAIVVQSKVIHRAHGKTQLPPGDWLLTTIRDSGVGIPPEDLPHIFERFYRGDGGRADDSSSRSACGAGLGLAIVKSIIDAHHGHIWAESAPGKGTTMAFALRLA